MQEVFEVIIHFFLALIQFLVMLFLRVLDAAYAPFKYVTSPDYRTKIQDEYPEQFRLYLHVFGRFVLYVMIFVGVVYVLSLPFRYIGFGDKPPPAKDGKTIEINDEDIDKIKNFAIDFIKDKMADQDAEAPQK